MKRIIAVLLLISLLVCCVGCTSKTSTQTTQTNKHTQSESSDAKAISLAAYPKRAQFSFDDHVAYERWHKEWQKRKELFPVYQQAVSSFSAKTIPQILLESDDENCVYSPMNLWLALAMVSETCAGQSRQQILDLLGSDSAENVREMAKAMWEANYLDDGVSTSVLANSVWLSDRKQYKKEVLKTLADDYYASSFTGEMGSPEYNDLLHDWLNEQTKGLLQEQADSMQFYEETVLALASAVYFRSAWSHEFYESASNEQVFHAPSGDREMEFMHDESYMTYYWGDEFGALWLRMESGGGMWILLPDEGITLESVLSSDEYLRFQQAGRNWERQYGILTQLALPKFDVSGRLDLIRELEKLGITDIFHVDSADFSPVFDNFDDMAVSQITHAARVKVDEKGCEAAAFTLEAKCEEAEPDPNQNIKIFTVDRPFLFLVTEESGSILFAGAVYEP